MAITRRRFLRDASVGAAAAGTAAAWAPGLLGLASSAGPEVSSDAPSVASVASVASVVSADGPVVAHVIDASSGTVAVYHGTQEVIVHSPSLVSALHAALR